MKNILYESELKYLAFERQRILGTLPHLHKHIEIIYVESGHTFAFAGKKSHEMENGKVFITFPNQVHYYENPQIGKYHLIIVSADMFLEEKKFFFENEPINNVVTDTDGSILKLIKSLYKAEGIRKGIEELGIVNQVILSILKGIQLEPRVKGENYTLQRILSYCRENYFNGITLDTVADELQLSKYHISHLLNQGIGIGFCSYINHLRIDRACKLLRETEKMATKIADEVGFGSLRSFNRAFQSIMNTTPVEYRASLSAATQRNEKENL